MSLKLELTGLSSELIEWYISNNNDRVKEALYHGWKVVNSIEYKNKLNCSDNAIIESLRSENASLRTKKEKEVCRYNEMVEEYEQKLKNNREIMKKELMDGSTKEIELLNKFIESLEGNNSALKDANRELLNDKSRIQEELNELNTKLSCSISKGNYGEELLIEYLEVELNKGYNIKDMSKTSHVGDIHIEAKNMDSSLMLESKYYGEISKYQIKKEIEKFRRDIEYCKTNSIKIHGGIFISLGCDIPNITDSYKYIECNGYREHYIANMDDSKHLLLKNIIEMETLIYKNNLDSNKSEDISELIHSYFLDLINYSNMIEKLDPDFKSIVDMIKKKERGYNKQKKEILHKIESCRMQVEKLVNTDRKYEFDEITSNFVSKSSPNQLNQEEFEEAQQLLQMSKTKYENLISENLELKLKIDNKVLEKESNKTDDMIECEICQTSIKKSNKTRHQKTKKCMEAKK
jgi:hypothetical protein